MIFSGVLRNQGWVTGTSYGIIGPWSLGTTQVHYGGGYDAQEWISLLSQERITVWYSAPTAFRMLMREDEGIFAGVDLSSLRHIYSVGEPLNPEVIYWARRLLKRDIYDTWFQTETGAIMIAIDPDLTSAQVPWVSRYLGLKHQSLPTTEIFYRMENRVISASSPAGPPCLSAT